MRNLWFRLAKLQDSDPQVRKATVPVLPAANPVAEMACGRTALWPSLNAHNFICGGCRGAGWMRIHPSFSSESSEMAFRKVMSEPSDGGGTQLARAESLRSGGGRSCQKCQPYL